MTKYYTVRISLHKDHVELSHDAKAHTTLHSAMEAEGYKRTITGEDGITYRLPPGEYAASSGDQINCARVRDHVSGIAATTGVSYSVYVCEVVTFAWEGLEKV